MATGYRFFPLSLLVGFLIPQLSDAEGADRFQLPLETEWVVSQPFGEASFSSDPGGSFCGYHLGTDVVGQPGTEVRCVANGTVVFARRVLTLGFAVHIQHFLPDGTEVTSVYYHLDESPDEDIREGQQVTLGTILGVLTGDPRNYGGGPHLHWGIRKGAHQGGIDPRTGKWFYPGYTTIYTDRGRTCDTADPLHQTILSEWVDPEVFIKSSSPTPVATLECVLILQETGEPVPGATVHVYRYFAETGDIEEMGVNSSDGNGLVSFLVPPGAYFVEAFKSIDGIAFLRGETPDLLTVVDREVKGVEIQMILIAPF